MRGVRQRSSSCATWGKASPTQPQRRRLRADLNPSDFFLRPPRTGIWGHTYRLLQGPYRLRHRNGAILVREQIAGTPSLVTFSIYLKKTVGPSIVRHLSSSTCVIALPIHWHFFLYCYLRLFTFIIFSDYFSYPQTPTSLCGYYWPSWPFLPLINKIQ